MGYTRNSHLCPEIQNSTAFFIILLILSSTHARFTPRGGSNSKLIDNNTQVIDNEDEDYGQMGVRIMMIGSKPPTCDWKKYCRRCGKCEAIQAPIVGPSRSTNTTTRRDDISNYKPMCWKCKCGDFIFNP
ncbi:hypothetical protein L1987_13747 [Smallanthus sonchifolius]|uniref:Uncharacterized protein n=1 Tax=Smallanthus sonchifolius TaxID=185202 RepID=A0ACB9JHE8_9ASTR|nr:hypothetical protein L1987_13747 [Smallanthus sonchifolius]